MLIGLIAILIAVFVLPFLFKKIEENLEIFLFVAGLSAALVARQINRHLIQEAFLDPLPITAAVFIFGCLFKIFRKYLNRFIEKSTRIFSIPLFIFGLIFILGMISSMITAIIAALILVEIISTLKLDKKHEIDLVIIACFSIGLGAALTPLGEPLSTIAIAKLKSWPDVNFWYLFKLLGFEIFGGILALSILSLFFHPKLSKKTLTASSKAREENYLAITIRALKVYLFVMALVFLGQGFKPLIDTYVIRLSGDSLYWINIVSAILDNATLTAAEISPTLQVIQIKKILLGLLIAGGMLIPGNIPNIIAASKLKITMKEWARLGVPLGLVLMVVYFFILLAYS